MAYKVLTDGNGSKLIRVVGMGDYLPVSEFQKLQAELKEAKSVIREIASFGHDSTDKEIADEALRVSRAWVANQP